MALVEVTEEMIEALLVGMTGRADLAEPPLAAEGRRVTRSLQDFRDRDVLGAAASGDRDSRRPRCRAPTSGRYADRS